MRTIPVALAAAVLAAATPALAQTDTITLGAAVQLTGRLANTGRYYGDGYQLAVDKLEVVYQRAITALQGISLVVTPGQVVGTSRLKLGSFS